MNKTKFEIFKSKIDKLMNHFNVGNYEYVFKEVQILDKKYPNNSFLFNLSGYCLLNLGKPEESKKFFNYSISIDKNNLAAINNLGNAHKQLYEFEEAEKCFNKVLSKNSKHIQSLINLGGLKYELNKLEEAIELFNKAIEIDN